MSDPASTTPPPDIAAIAGKLTSEECEAIRTGRAKTEQMGVDLFRKGITRHDLRSRVKVYSDLGLAVRAHLLSKEQNDGR